MESANHISDSINATQKEASGSAKEQHICSPSPLVVIVDCQVCFKPIYASSFEDEERTKNVKFISGLGMIHGSCA